MHTSFTATRVCDRCEQAAAALNRDGWCLLCESSYQADRRREREVAAQVAQANGVAEVVGYNPFDPLAEKPRKPKRKWTPSCIKLWGPDAGGELARILAAQTDLWSYLSAAYSWSQRLTATMHSVPALLLRREFEGHAREWRQAVGHGGLTAQQADAVAAAFGKAVTRLKRLPATADAPQRIRVPGDRLRLSFDTEALALCLAIQGSASTWHLKRHHYIRRIADQDQATLGKFALWNQRRLPTGRVRWIDARPPTTPKGKWQFVLNVATREATPARHDWQGERERQTEARDDKVLDLHRQGASIAGIARETGITRKSVLALLRRHGSR